MIQQSKGKIFLAEERGSSQAEKFSSRSTFNFGKYFNEHKKPFGNIYVVNDEILDAGCSLKIQAEDLSYVILLPVMGAIASKDSSGNKNLIAAGQAEIINLDKGATLEISNPFDEGAVNYLQIWIKADQNIIAKGNESKLCTYNVNESIDRLINILPDKLATTSLPFAAWIGKFNGRGETVYHLRGEKSGLFVFVIEGAFEVQGRLLHARDGLALWEINDAEIEALSNDAIIFVIESSLQ
jgi:quercetin 2,3-dioxygenase